MRTLANVCLVCSDTETAAEAAREALKIAQEAGIFMIHCSQRLLRLEE